MQCKYYVLLPRFQQYPVNSQFGVQPLAGSTARRGHDPDRLQGGVGSLALLLFHTAQDN